MRYMILNNLARLGNLLYKIWWGVTRVCQTSKDRGVKISILFNKGFCYGNTRRQSLKILVETVLGSDTEYAKLKKPWRAKRTNKVTYPTLSLCSHTAMSFIHVS